MHQSQPRISENGSAEGKISMKIVIWISKMLEEQWHRTNQTMKFNQLLRHGFRHFLFTFGASSCFNFCQRFGFPGQFPMGASRSNTLDFKVVHHVAAISQFLGIFELQLHYFEMKGLHHQKNVVCPKSVQNNGMWQTGKIEQPQILLGQTTIPQQILVGEGLSLIHI